MADNYNPIRTLNGVTVPSPSSYEVLGSDVSSSDAGRTEDAKMWKMKITELTKLQLEWQNLKTADMSTILQAIDDEYFDVTYLDPKAGTYLTKNFYVGDRASVAYNTRMGLWSSLSFNLIERGGV